MRRKKSRRHHRGVISERLRSNWRAIGLYGVTGVIMIGAVAFAWQAAGEDLGPDGCRATAATQPHIAVLLDGTDRLKPFAVNAVKLKMHQIKNALPTHSRLSVFGLVPAEQGIVTQAFSQCTPKPAAQVNVFIEQEANLKKQNDSFDAGYQAAVQQVLDQASQQESHIIAALYAVTAHDITDLVVISDMLQHTPTGSGSMLRGNFRGADNSLYVVGITHRLQGMKILIIQLGTKRWAAHQKAARAYWEKLFTKAGAKVMWVDLPNALQ